VASWVTKAGVAGSCNFLTDRCKFPTQEIMGAQNFNFTPKMGISAQNFVSWMKFF